MSKFKAARIIIRQLGTIDIYFYQTNSVYVFYKDSHEGAVFHNWDNYGRYVADWQPFRVKMLRYQNLTMAKCYELAEYHDIAHISTGRALKLDGKSVELRAKNYKIIGEIKSET